MYNHQKTNFYRDVKRLAVTWSTQHYQQAWLMSTTDTIYDRVDLIINMICPFKDWQYTKEIMNIEN